MALQSLVYFSVNIEVVALSVTALTTCIGLKEVKVRARLYLQQHSTNRWDCGVPKPVSSSSSITLVRQRAALT